VRAHSTTCLTEHRARPARHCELFTDDVDPVRMFAHGRKLTSKQGKQIAPVHGPCRNTSYTSFTTPWCSELVPFAAQVRCLSFRLGLARNVRQTSQRRSVNRGVQRVVML
jgi:hypothetical protein